MEWTQEESRGLRLLSSLPEKECVALIGVAVQDVVHEDTQDTQQAVAACPSMETASVKSVFAALVSALVQTAKHRTSSLDLSNALDDLGVRGAHQQALVEAAEQNQSQLRKSLRLLGGSGQPRLLGVRWRLDYLVAESRQKAAPRPFYTLEFETSDGPQTIVASPEDLQDIIGQLRDAVKVDLSAFSGEGFPSST